LLASRSGAMWQFLKRLFYGAISFAIFAAVITGCSSYLACEALAQEEQLSKSGKVDQQIIIREHAGWNRDCDAIAHPALFLDEPPRHGRVCVRVENIKIRSMFIGTESQCIRRVVMSAESRWRCRGWPPDRQLPKHDAS
jgi:hypothetical protein